MREKSTYREKGKVRPRAHPSRGAWRADKRTLDAVGELDEELAQIVKRWAVMFSMRRSEADLPSVRETLRTLRRESNESLSDALRKIDMRTLTELNRVAYLDAKRRDVKFSLRDWRTWSPDQVRDYAAAAAQSIPVAPGSKVKIAGLYPAFAAVLLAYWMRTNANPPTIWMRDNLEPSPFLKWAANVFTKAGVPMSPQSLRPILSAAKRG